MPLLTRLNWRDQRGLDLLAFQLPAEKTELRALVDAGTPVRTLLNLYPFDFEECAATLSHALKSHPHLSLFCNNLWALSGQLFDDATAPRSSQAHEKIEVDYLTWVRARGSYKRLYAELTDRMVELNAVGSASSQTSYSRRRVATERAEVELEIIFKALAFAERAAIQPELFMASHLKASVDHVLIFLTDPSVYENWGTRNRPGRW